MVTEQLQKIQQRIDDACQRAGRKPGTVHIVAVTKTLEPTLINEAIAAGLSDIGENRVQEYLGKREELLPHRFHMIGHLQKNKVRQIIELAAMIHSVDSVALAQEIDKRAASAGITCDILLEVNSSGEESKFGLAPERVLETGLKIAEFAHLRMRGLMTVAKYCENPEDVRPSFTLLRNLKDELTDGLAGAPNAGHWNTGHLISELSMGMSNDFEVAIEEGATIIRLGTALFGERNQN